MRATHHYDPLRLPFVDWQWACLWSGVFCGPVFLGMGLYISSWILLGSALGCLATAATLYGYGRYRCQHLPAVDRGLLAYLSDEDLEHLERLQDVEGIKRAFAPAALSTLLGIRDVGLAIDLFKRLNQARLVYRVPRRPQGTTMYALSPDAAAAIAAERERRDRDSLRVEPLGLRSRASGLAV